MKFNVGPLPHIKLHPQTWQNLSICIDQEVSPCYICACCQPFVAFVSIQIIELIPQQNPDDINILIPSFLSIWNDPANLPFLSFTGRVFTEELLHTWCEQHLSAGIHYFAAMMTEHAVTGILVIKENVIEGFEIQGLGVLPSQKRKGIGSRLVKHGVELAKMEGYQAIDVQVYAPNIAMLRLVLAEGFIPVRMEHRRGPKGEDLIHLKKYM